MILVILGVLLYPRHPILTWPLLILLFTLWFRSVGYCCNKETVPRQMLKGILLGIMVPGGGF